jgi:putative (di)nucleoside polyphosphate hydrolase
MLANRAGQVFVAQRNDTAEAAWQMPQGGIDPGEAPHAAALRELAEETGIPAQRVETVAETQGWLRYDLPDALLGTALKGRYRGQEQKWFLLRYVGRDDQIDLATEHPEFSDWQWIAPAEVPGLIVPFKRPIYEAVVAEFAPHL